MITVAPFIELRGSIPFGMAAGLSPLLVIVSCIAFNLLLIPLLFVVLHFVFEEAQEIPGFGPWFKKRLVKTHKKAGKYVDKYGVFGLALFVAVPLPGTGAYSGALAAYLLGMDKKKAVIAVAVGVLIAGIIVSLASMGILNLFGL